VSERRITVGVTQRVWIDANVEIDPAEVLRDIPDSEVLAEAIRRGLRPSMIEKMPEHSLDPIRTHIEEIEAAFRAGDRQHFRVVMERLCAEIGLVPT
jgi:hypothetical protein